jgi:tetratricopeptide (TPR) repeat protein
MNPSLTPEDMLLRNLLAADEASKSRPEPAVHPDEESLVLFAHAALSAAEREAVIAHLDQCNTCRQTVSRLLRLEEEQVGEQTTVAPVAATARWTTVRLTALALAACLLVAVGIAILSPGSGRQLADARFYDQAKAQLELGQFDRAQETIRAAEKDGVRSDWLLSLNAQAERRLPATIALSVAGRLTQFGYDTSGTMTKEFQPLPISEGAQKALDVLSAAHKQELETLLNRGHALLSLGQAKPALEVFEQATRLDPQSAYARLGRGMASFMLDDYAAAEHDFREALRLDPKLIAAEINLAMTLAEEGRRGDAVEIWRKLLKQPLSDSDRDLATQALSTLEKK